MVLLVELIIHGLLNIFQYVWFSVSPWGAKRRRWQCSWLFFFYHVPSSLQPDVDQKDKVNKTKTYAHMHIPTVQRMNLIACHSCFSILVIRRQWSVPTVMKWYKCWRCFQILNLSRNTTLYKNTPLEEKVLHSEPYLQLSIQKYLIVPAQKVLSGKRNSFKSISISIYCPMPNNINQNLETQIS